MDENRRERGRKRSGPKYIENMICSLLALPVELHWLNSMARFRFGQPRLAGFGPFVLLAWRISAALISVADQFIFHRYWHNLLQSGPF